MPVIEIKTKIRAPIERCFDLCRSIDLHMISTAQSHEKAIAGRTTGLIELGETVTWQAKHLGVNQKLSVKITEMVYPTYFCDEMLKGAFQDFRHEHHFECVNNRTLMIDRFDFTSPMGMIGQAFNHLFLTQYMHDFLVERNQVIKEFAESDHWKEVLKVSV